MKRILGLVTVVALMMVMLAMAVAPAFAAWEGACRTGSTLVDTGPGDPFAFVDSKDRNNDDHVCFFVGGDHAHYYDNRLI